MTFTIAEIELPLFPQSIARKLTRKPTVTQTNYDYPVPTDTGPQSFNLEVKGLIWGSEKAQELWELTKDAEGEVISIIATGDEEDSYSWVNGLYACTKAEVKQMKNETTLDDGEQAVWKFSCTFTQYAEAGAFEPGDIGGIEFDEPGIGFGSFEEIFGEWDFDAFSIFEGYLGIYN